jgi:hypothetical protein
MGHLCNSASISPAIWALLGVIVGGFITGLFNLILQCRQFKHNKELFLLQNKSQEQAKEILDEMLNNKKYVDRSFLALKGKIGGFSDDEIRKLLLEIGAIKTTRKDDNSEWWYMKDRKEERNQK